MKPAFAIWITGLPASGKSTLARALAGWIRARGTKVVILESDELRRVVTSNPTYSDEERDFFYRALAGIARLLTEQDVPVIIDATGNRRAYRDRARKQISRFVKVFVDCPLAVCIGRDPKGLYRNAAGHLPGVGAAYEAPLQPEIIVNSDREAVEMSVLRIAEFLASRGYLEAEPCSSTSAP